MHYIPKKRRAKLDQRWTTGVFLGTTMHSNENYIALTNGCVVRGRAITRVRPDQRRDRKLVQDIKGTPAEPLSRDDADIEDLADPHANAEERDMEPPEGEPVISDRAKLRTRILLSDINEFGPSDRCPR